MASGDAARITETRGNGYHSPAALQQRAALKRAALERLAEADAFASMGPCAPRSALGGSPSCPRSPQAALRRNWMKWPKRRRNPQGLPLPEPGEEVAADYESTGFSLRSHPVCLLREAPETAGHFAGTVPAARLARLPNGASVRVSGLVIVRQMPGTARGVLFITLEDESGSANAIIWPDVLAAHRRAALASRLIAIHGRLQRQGIVTHVIAKRLVDLSHLLDGLSAPGSRSGVRAMAREFR